MFRIGTVLTLVAGLGSVAYAQAPGQGGPPMPVGMDLKKVSPGSWASYTVSLGSMPPMKTKIALVGKSAGSNTIEMTFEGGMMAAAGGAMVMQMQVDGDPAKESAVKKIIMQMAENDPMEMQINEVQKKQFQRPDPKTLVKEESITVAAGTFKVKHYRDKTVKGDQFDFWISDKAPPFGLVKMVGENKNVPAPAAGPVTFELAQLGGGAKRVITKKAKPFDQAALMGQMLGGNRGAPGSGGLGPRGPGGPPAPPMPPPSKK